MSEYNYSKEAYELEEALLNAELAFKQIESKYSIKHMVLEASGQLSPEEFMALEEEDSNNESEDKRGVLKKLIDTILEKIRNFLNKFKKDRTKWEDIKPDTEIDAPVSEEELRKYIKSGDIISQKLDKVVETAQGSDLKAYEQAVNEYEEATKDTAWLDSISSELVSDDVDKSTKGQMKRYIVKASVITAALAVVNRLTKGFENIISLMNDTIPGAAGGFFAKMNIKKEEIDKQAADLNRTISKDFSRTRNLGNLFDKVYEKMIGKMKTDKRDKDYNATREELKKQQDAVKGTADTKVTIFGDQWNNVTMMKWINEALNRHLDLLADRSDRRPKLTDIGTFMTYVYKDKVLGFDEYSNDVIVQRLLNVSNGKKLDDDRTAEYKNFIGRITGQEKMRPVFFDIWAIGFKKVFIFGDIEKYKQFQRNLLQVCNDYRKKKNMPEIKWDESRAIEYIEIMTAKDPTKDYTWEKYIEDKNNSNNSNSNGGQNNSNSQNDNGSIAKTEFLKRYYKTMSSKEFNTKMEELKKNDTVSDNNYCGFSNSDIMTFPNDYFKDGYKNFEDIEKEFKDKLNAKPAVADEIITLAKTKSSGNIMRWTKRRLEEFKTEADRKYGGSAKAFLNILYAAGFDNKYCM